MSDQLELFTGIVVRSLEQARDVIAELISSSKSVSQ